MSKRDNATDPKILELLKRNEKGVFIDLGCGANKQKGFIGVDYRDMPGVDVVWDLEIFPYPFPDNCASTVLTSHVVEHLNPHQGDARLSKLIELLLKKKLLTESEVAATVGEINPGPIFMRFMDEVWRILKPGGQFMLAFPYAGSTGYWQDPTHCNGINEATWAYFDPLEPHSGGGLYRIYQPKPWKIHENNWTPTGNMEVLLEKRIDDKSYHN